jgi:methyl-accepting chemotaxis protein
VLRARYGALGAAIRKAGDAAVAMRAQTRETERVPVSGREAPARAKDAIRRLETESRETAKILGATASIARQTDLLAANASVEAARTGSAGTAARVLAVASAEVRALAGRAAAAAPATAPARRAAAR